MSNDEELWRPFEDSYELSNKGRMRRTTGSIGRVKAGYLMTPANKSRVPGNRSYQIYRGGKRVSLPIRSLMEQVWPEVDFRPDKAWLSWLQKDNAAQNANIPGAHRTGKTKSKKVTEPFDSKRLCAGGCGRMITDYKCKACWRKSVSAGDFMPAPSGYTLSRTLMHLGI